MECSHLRAPAVRLAPPWRSLPRQIDTGVSVVARFLGQLLQTLTYFLMFFGHLQYLLYCIASQPGDLFD
jgi:hypothetical protein